MVDTDRKKKRLEAYARKIGKPVSEFTTADRRAAEGHKPKGARTEYQERIFRGAAKLGKRPSDLTPDERRRITGKAPRSGKGRSVRVSRERALQLAAIQRNLRAYAKALNQKGKGKGPNQDWKVDLRPSAVWGRPLAIVYTFYGRLKRGVSEKVDAQGARFGYVSVSDHNAGFYSVGDKLATLDARVRDGRRAPGRVEEARRKASVFMEDPMLFDIVGVRERQG